MNFDQLLQIISSYDFNVQLEEQFVLLYKEYNLLLELVPHKYRKEGFFYEECKRVGRFDLIPQLTTNEILNLKEDYEKKNNSLNRVDAKSLKLKRVSADIHYLRAYTHQVLNSYFGFTDKCNQQFDSFNKPLGCLSKDEILSIVPLNYININEDKIFFYFFDKNLENQTKQIINCQDVAINKQEEINDLVDHISYDKFPDLFTSVEQVSFDQGGLVKLECFGYQIYELYSFDGEFITGPCHDLDLLANGKFVERSSDSTPGFHLNKYNFLSKSIESIDVFGDLSGETSELLNIFERDRINFDSQGFPFLRVENFEKPSSKNDVIKILQDSNSNWITSPELVEFYKNDKELAILAIERDKLAYSVLDNDLREDKDLQIKVCDYYYCREYNFKLEKLFTYAEIEQLALLDGRILKYLSKDYKGNKEFILSIISNSIRNTFDNIDWLRFISKELLNDNEVALKAISIQGTSIRWFSENIKDDTELVKIGLNQDGSSLSYASERFKKNKEIVMIALNNNGYVLKYVSKELRDDFEVVMIAVKQDGSSLRYASEKLKSNKQIVEAAIRNSKWAINYADKTLQNDPEILQLLEGDIEDNGFYL